MTLSNTNRHGFSLFELLVVVSLSGVVLGVGILILGFVSNINKENTLLMDNIEFHQIPSHCAMVNAVALNASILDLIEESDLIITINKGTELVAPRERIDRHHEIKISNDFLALYPERILEGSKDMWSIIYLKEGLILGILEACEFKDNHLFCSFTIKSIKGDIAYRVFTEELETSLLGIQKTIKGHENFSTTKEKIQLKLPNPMGLNLDLSFNHQYFNRL